MRRSLLLLLIVLLVVPALVSAQDGQPITIGEVVSGEITNENPVDTYTFTGTAGQMIVISMTAPQGGLDSYLTVIAPDGSESSNDDSNGTLNSTLPFVLPVDGTYTIRAARCCGEQAESGSQGAYELRVDSASIQALTVGASATVEISDEQPSAYIALAAQPGQILRMEAVSVDGDALFMIDVRDPSGVAINGVSQMEGFPTIIDPFFITQEGQYMLMVSRQIMYPQNEESGERVSLTITITEAVPQVIAIGDTVSGTLDDASSAMYYAFDATTSDLLRLSGSRAEGSAEFEVAVFSASGMGFNSGGTAYGPEVGTFVIDPLQVQESGRVLLVVRPTILGDPEQVGGSSFTLTLEPTQTPVLQSGSPVEGSFSEGTFESVYRFEGTAGQKIRVTIGSVTDDYAPALNIQGPALPVEQVQLGVVQNFYVQISGSTAASATYEFTLPQDGAYLFRVNNNAYNPTGVTEGKYMLMLEVLE